MAMIFACLQKKKKTELISGKVPYRTYIILARNLILQMLGIK